MTYDKERFAGNLRANRARSRMTQDQLAEASGVTAAAIRSYENALNVPSVENAAKLADALDVSLDQLVGER
jgi:transcriptional regulator with XRE-family HTH domain